MELQTMATSTTNGPHGAHAAHALHAPHGTIEPQRLHALATAVELEVDEAEIEFESAFEVEIWQSLRDEFEEFVAKIGPVWIAD